MPKLNLFSVGGLVLTICCLAVIAVNLIFGRKKVNYIWSLFNLSVAIWGFGAFMVGISGIQQQPWFWWKINHIGVIWMPVFVLHTAYLLTTKVNKKIVIFGYVQAVCFQIVELLPTTLFFENMRVVFSSFYYVTLGYLYTPFFILWVLLVAYAHICIFQEFIVSTGMKRLSLLYFLIGSGLGFSGGFTNFLIGYKIDIPPYGNFTIPIYCILVTYAIIKYRLMDVRVAISRAAAFLLAYPFLLGIPFFFAYRMYPVLFPMLGDKWWLIHTCLMAFFATLSPLAFNQLKHRMEDTLLADQRRYQKLLLEAASGMVNERNLNHLAKLIVYIIRKVVKIKFAAIFLDDAEHQVYRLKAIRNGGSNDFEIKFFYTHPLVKFLKTSEKPIAYEELPQNIRNSLHIPIKFDVAVPSFVDNNLLGFVFLGEKLNSHPYTHDDLMVFKTLSHQAALAINYCLFLETFKNAQEKIFTADKQGLIGGMADGVAHQIRNRLNQFSISGGELQGEVEDFIAKNPELIAQNPSLKQNLEDYLKIALSIIANVQHTANTVNGMLNFAQKLEDKESGFSDFHIGEIGTYALNMLKIKHQISEIPLELDLGKDDTVYGIQPQIMESLYNLIDNAYEATDEKIRYRLKDEEKKNYKPQIKLKVNQNETYTLVAISDNGAGIKEQDRSKLFAPFFTTKSSYKSGTGIGIYTVKRIIEEVHSGKIWFESEYLKGTTFYIKLPKRGAKL